MAKRKRCTVEEFTTIKRIQYDETTQCVKLSNMTEIVKSWIVRGEVSSVSSLRLCTIGKAQKSVLNFELRDDTGLVRATAYGKTADRIHDKLQNGMNMQINNFKIKAVNPAFNSNGNDYEIELDERTLIRELIGCPATGGEKKTVHFTEFHDIQSTTDTAINVVGVIKRVGDIKEIPTQSSGKILLKRDVTLMDDKKNTCVVTMWNDDAKDWIYVPRDIITISGAGVNKFCGFYSVKLYRTSVVVKDAVNEKSVMLKGLLDELMPESQ
ncbi:hypothetical protein TKK_0003008 [Trichogramma kaykai]